MKSGRIATPALLWLASLAFLAPLPARACTVTSTITGKVFQSITAAIAGAQTVDWFTVDGASGPCAENVLIPNTFLRIVLQGVHGAVINGTGAGAVLDLRVKGSMIQNLTVNGGSVGIVVQRNANAVIDAVQVQNSSGPGIVVTSMAFAVITNSVVQGNQLGILLTDFASANIGINDPFAGNAYAPNTIQSNTFMGIMLERNATARIFSNTIAGNKVGIFAQFSSSFVSGGNLINANTASGIGVERGATGVIGTDYHGAAFPERTTQANGLSGIECSNGSYVEGHLGTSSPLAGASAQTNLDPTCVGLSSHLVP
jgi:parallel beta-helix repeat protein